MSLMATAGNGITQSETIYSLNRAISKISSADSDLADDNEDAIRRMKSDLEEAKRLKSFLWNFDNLRVEAQIWVQKFGGL